MNDLDIQTEFATVPNFGKLITSGIYNIPQFIRVAIQFLFVAGAVGFFIFLLWGGVDWILAGGDKEGLEKARKKITGAIIGLAILLSGYAFATLSEVIFGVNILGNINIPTL